MPRVPFKRFYEQAGIGPAGADFAVLLDGRPVKTPAGAALAMASRALAEAVAAEWAAQADQVDLRTMLLTALVCTAIDRVRPNRDPVIGQVVAYGAHDLVCYRAAAPADLAARQAAAWQPLLDWAADRHGARLEVTSGAVSIPQPAEALSALRGAVEALDHVALAALASAVGVAGSLIVGLALAEGRLSPDQAHAAAFVDELYQAERWGEDREAAHRRATIRADLEAARRVFVLVGSGA
ncbi:MAG: ATP12 family protein [Kiloniellaceae bacterium]